MSKIRLVILDSNPASNPHNVELEISGVRLERSARDPSQPDVLARVLRAFNEIKNQKESTLHDRYDIFWIDRQNRRVMVGTTGDIILGIKEHSGDHLLNLYFSIDDSDHQQHNKFAHSSVAGHNSAQLTTYTSAVNRRLTDVKSQQQQQQQQQQTVTYSPVSVGTRSKLQEMSTGTNHHENASSGTWSSASNTPAAASHVDPTKRSRQPRSLIDGRSMPPTSSGDNVTKPEIQPRSHLGNPSSSIPNTGIMPPFIGTPPFGGYPTQPPRAALQPTGQFGGGVTSQNLGAPSFSIPSKTGGSQKGKRDSWSSSSSDDSDSPKPMARPPSIGKGPSTGMPPFRPPFNGAGPSTGMPPFRPPSSGAGPSTGMPPFRPPASGAGPSTGIPPFRPPFSGAGPSTGMPPFRPPSSGAGPSTGMPPFRPPSSGAGPSTGIPPFGPPLSGAGPSTGMPPFRPPSSGAGPSTGMPPFRPPFSGAGPSTSIPPFRPPSSGAGPSTGIPPFGPPFSGAGPSTGMPPFGPPSSGAGPSTGMPPFGPPSNGSGHSPHMPSFPTQFGNDGVSTFTTYSDYPDSNYSDYHRHSPGRRCQVVSEHEFNNAVYSSNRSFSHGGFDHVPYIGGASLTIFPPLCCTSCSAYIPPGAGYCSSCSLCCYSGPPPCGQ